MFGLKRKKQISRTYSKLSPPPLIKFKIGDLGDVRGAVLDDLSREHFALLLAKRVPIGNSFIFTVVEVKYLNEIDYNSQSLTHLSLNKKFIYNILSEVTQREDIDTIIDVHTHPFSKNSVSFSGIDDRDEQSFLNFLHDKFDDVHYCSIVFSQQEYSARYWYKQNGNTVYCRSIIKTQLPSENISSSDFKKIIQQNCRLKKIIF